MTAKLYRLLKVYGKVFSLVLAILFGLVIPQAHNLSFLIQYLLIIMLFFAFLDVEIKIQNFPLSVFLILLANIAIAFIGYCLLIPFNKDLALVAFITGIAPSAIASPIIVSFLEKKVEYVIAAVLLTNVVSAFTVPFALPWLTGEIATTSVWSLLKPTLVVMFIPLILSRYVFRLPLTIQKGIREGKRLLFVLWLSTLFIISAKATYFIRYEYSGSGLVLIQISLLALVICTINFVLGALIGGHHYWQEASQALGQKNNSFVIWISLSFLTPLIALGPTFYIIYHNLYNSFQIYSFEKKRGNKSHLTKYL